MKVQCWSQNKTTPKTQPYEKPHPFPCCLLSLSCLRFCLFFFCGPSYLKVFIQCPIFSLKTDILKNRKTVHSNKFLNEKSCLKAAVKTKKNPTHCGLLLCVFLDCEQDFFSTCTLASDHSLVRVAREMCSYICSAHS